MLTGASVQAIPFTAQELQSIRQEVQRVTGVALDNDGEGSKELSRSGTVVNTLGVSVGVDRQRGEGEWIKIYIGLLSHDSRF